MTNIHHHHHHHPSTLKSKPRDPLRTNALWSLVFLVTMAVMILQSETKTIPKFWRMDTQQQQQQHKIDQSCSCPETNFPKRLHHEEESFDQAWNQSVQYIQSHQLTYLDSTLLEFHRNKLSDIERQGIPGMIFECGVAKGGSAIAFTSYKHPQRCLHLFDTFSGIPEPTEKDGPDVLQRYAQIQVNKKNCELGLKCDRSYYGNMEDLLAFDIAQFESAGYKPLEHSVFFHKGLFGDTVWPAGPIAYAHLDGDWYESTYQMLERISPYLSIGGYFVLDDVYQWSGAKNAYLDYFGVQYEWLEQHYQDHGCWTVVTYPEGNKGYFRLMLDVRAFAQAIPPIPADPSTTSREEASSYPKCSSPPPPPPPASSTSGTATDP